MSSAFELMPPAGFVLSLEKDLTIWTFPSISAWVVATFPPFDASECLGLLLPPRYRGRCRMHRRCGSSWRGECNEGDVLSPYDHRSKGATKGGHLLQVRVRSCEQAGHESSTHL